MILIFFFMLLGLGCYFVYKLIGPELNIQIDSILPRLPWRRTTLSKDVLSQPHESRAVFEEVVEAQIKPDPEYVIIDQDKTDLLERMLTEKNIEIERLQQAIDAERQHRFQFEKSQELLQEEIMRLKQEIKQLRRQGV